MTGNTATPKPAVKNKVKKTIAELQAEADAALVALEAEKLAEAERHQALAAKKVISSKKVAEKAAENLSNANKELTEANKAVQQYKQQVQQAKTKTKTSTTGDNHSSPPSASINWPELWKNFKDGFLLRSKK